MIMIFKSASFSHNCNWPVTLGMGGRLGGGGDIQEEKPSLSSTRTLPPLVGTGSRQKRENGDLGRRVYRSGARTRSEIEEAAELSCIQREASAGVD